MGELEALRTVIWTGALAEATDCLPNWTFCGEITSASGGFCVAPNEHRARTSTPGQILGIGEEINGCSAPAVSHRRWPYPAAPTWRPLRAQPQNHGTCPSKARSLQPTLTFDA